MGLGRNWLCAVVFGSLLGMGGGAQAGNLPPTAASGVAWLQSQLQANGSLSNEGLSIATPLQARSETATALGLSGPIPANLLAAITADTGTDTESLARHIDALVQAGQDPSAQVQLLLASQNTDGGFGSEPGDSSDPLDTAWALIALRQVNSSNATALGNGLQYLIGSVNADGGYGLPASGSGSEVYVTAYVLLAYQSYANSYPLTPQISGSGSWLVSQQASGVYGDTLSDAIAVLALSASSTDATTYSVAVNALSGAQQADGSWAEDPYLTALAVRALAGSLAQVTASTGGISGTVLDAVSHAPIAGAQVQVTGSSTVSTATAANGSFAFSGLAPGSYTLSVTAADYTPVSLQSIQVTAGGVTTVGALALTAVPSLSGLTGRFVTASGAPLAGVVITLSGADTASATSGADGSYAFTNLSPGVVNITVTAAGYDTITGAAGLNAGLVLDFSPALYATGTTPSSASLTGMVEDAASQAPIAGALVSISGSSAQTDAGGHFTLTGLSAGSYTASVSAGGYTGASLSGSLADGANSAGLVLLTAVPPANNSSSVSGVVTDAATGKAIAGASVQVQGQPIAAITGGDGSYQLTGIADPQFVLLFSAPGYLSRNSEVGLAVPGTATVNVALTAAASTGLLVQSVSLPQSSYNPFTEAEIDASFQNTTAQSQQVILDAQVLDALGNVVQDIPAVQLFLGADPSTALQTIPAGGDLDQDFTFYVRSTPAGDYRVVVRATDVGGNVLAEGGTAVMVNPLAQIGGGLTLNPPISQANSDLPVHITADVSNIGNLPIGAGPLQLTVTLNDNSSTIAGPSPTLALDTYFAAPWYTNPVGSAKDAQGNLYVVDSYFGGPTFHVRKIAPDKTATIIATIPGEVIVNGIQYSVNNGGRSVEPVDLTVDPSGNIWVLNANRWVAKIAPAGTITYFDTGIPAQRYCDSDGSGNLYITGVNGADRLLVEMSPSGQVTTLVKNGLSKPVDVAADPQGNLYVTNFGDNTISKVSAGGDISLFVSGLNAPQGIVSDANGNLYVANSGANDILMISPTGVSSIYASGLNNPFGLAFDAQGDLYVTNSGNNSVAEVAPGGQVTTFAHSAASGPQGMRYDAQGDLFIANSGNNTVTEVDTSGAVHVLATGLSDPTGLAIDPSGSVFVTDYGSGAVSEISGGTTTTFATGLSEPYGIAEDGASNVYVAEYGGNRISEVPAGGGTPQVVAQSLLNQPHPVIVAPDGSLIVGNYYSISRIPLGGGATVTGIPNQAEALSFGPDGTLYYTDYSTLYKIGPTGAVFVANIPYTPGPALFDSQGDYFVADYDNKCITEVSSAGVKSTYAALPGNPSWLAEDASGDFFVVLNFQSVYEVTPTGVITQIKNSNFTYGVQSVTIDANGRLVVVNNNSDALAVVGTDGTTQVQINGMSWPAGAVELANGNLAVTDYINHVLRIYNPQGALQQQIWGFAGPSGMVWHGDELVFTDRFSRLYALVPGGYPVVVGGVNNPFFDMLGNSVYFSGVNNNIVATDISTGKSISYYSMGSGYYEYPGAVAVRSDGTLSIAEPSENEIVQVSPAKQVTATYAGIDNPSGIAIDNSGDVFVATRVASYSEVVEISPTGTTARPVAVTDSMTALGFDTAGNLDVSAYAGATNGIFRVNLPNGSLYPTVIANVPGIGIPGLTFSNGTLYAVDQTNLAVRELSGNSLPIYARGIASPYGVRLGPDGGVYVADYTGGVVLRYAQGGISTAVTGLTNPTALNFDPSGTLYVADSGGALMKVGSKGALSDVGVESLLSEQAIQDISFAANGDPLLDMSGWNNVQEVVFPKPPVLPAPGTVVYTTTAEAPSVAMMGSAAAVDFGSWTPPYSGDYTFTVSSAQAGVAGELAGSVHVGSLAQAQMSDSAPTPPPGDQPESISLGLQGEDFSSIAVVDPTNVAFDFQTGSNWLPPAMGVDPSGNFVFEMAWTIKVISPTGTTTTIQTDGIQLTGELPIDRQGNYYISTGNLIQKVTPTGQTSTYANLGGVGAMTLSPTGTLYAQSADTVYAVAPDGTFKLFYSAAGDVAGITSDGVGNLYVELLGNNIIKVTPDGTASELITQGDFEYEGRNIAGGCADNLFFTPTVYPGSGQSGEEHTLMEYVGDTSQISPVFNGLSFSKFLGDMDFIVYDRFHSELLMWTDESNGSIYSVPVYCGGIGVEAHVVTPAGQTLTGFSAAPTATLSHTDGTTEYVWNLQSVDTRGQSLQFGTVLNNLQIGQTQPVVQSAFLKFNNTFVANSDITLPIAVPKVQVAPMVALSVSTDAPSYPADTQVNIAVGLNDSYTTPASGMLDVKVLDADGTLVADVEQQTELVTPGSASVVDAVWNTGVYLDGNYTVQAALTGNDGTVLAQGSASFAIGVTSTTGGNGVLTVGVTTDKASYAPTDTVNLDERLINVTSNALDGNIALVATVTNPSGVVIWSNTSSVSQLVPGTLKDLLFQLPLANAAPGSYSVSVAVTLDGAALPTATAGFAVQSSAATASGVSGTLSVTPTQAPLTSPVTLTGTLANNGNAPISGATATLAVLDPVAGQLVFQSPVNVASLPQGQSLPLQAAWAAAGTVNQTYVALLMVNIGGVSKTVAQVNFKLLDPTAALTGSLTVNPSQVPLTANLSLMGSVTNAGPQVSGVNATLSVQDPTGTTVFSSPASIGSLAQGQASQLLANWLAAGPVNEMYTASLGVAIGNYSKTLATQAFEVIPPPIKIGAGLAEGVHGRVLILTDDPAAYPGNQDPFGPSPAPGLAAQNQHLGQVLTAAGWSYTIVTNAADFQTQFNTGGYEAYVILSEAVKLPESLQEQVDAAVNNGAGLIVAGNHDDRNNKLEDALGIHSTGKCLSVTSLELDPNSLDQAGGQVSFPIDGQPLTVNKDSATAVGNFELTGGGTAPAVFTYGYGSGKSVYVAFDLALEEAAANSPNSLFDQLMLDSLNYVSPTNLTPYTGRVIPLVLTLQNQGNATPAEAMVTLPTGVTVIDPNGATVSGNTLSWVFNLAVGQTLTETFWVQLPATAGSLTVPALVESGTAPNLTPQASASLLIAVQAKPQ